jgi:hypothetical protein
MGAARHGGGSRAQSLPLTWPPIWQSAGLSPTPMFGATRTCRPLHRMVLRATAQRGVEQIVWLIDRQPVAVASSTHPWFGP